MTKKGNYFDSRLQIIALFGIKKVKTRFAVAIINNEHVNCAYDCFSLYVCASVRLSVHFHISETVTAMGLKLHMYMDLIEGH